nr:MAG TPA: hypothetical protein [Caudoviricetes sp.]
MTDYIRREDALFALRKAERGGSMTALTRLERAYAEIRGMPAADVAEVVRCKDCELWDSDPDTYGKDTGPEGKCMKSFERMPADGFCSYGERREEP